MFRSLFKLAIILVVAVVAYNYFYGTPDEREQSREIVGKARDLGRDAWQLLQGEREKMREGKYDDALERLETLYTGLREAAHDVNDSGALDRLSELTRRREALEDSLEGNRELGTRARRELDRLTADTEVLMNEMEAQGRPGAPY
ncbi:hypothetical protein GGR26_000631 [Lewinella marina]|uniref:Uncharacterized protein n=1 Tax=Neolewinella marina TaxID=438751 RepID=A0A2G0CJ67_9BACT|nr:hypothetical protein [Neolewinella marina]NJB84886.1 hypothetical protein [Neolewinella marina]PHK99960.1 hypothetical protein CGL56_02625 [Neolewinella marina]